MIKFVRSVSNQPEKAGSKLHLQSMSSRVKYSEFRLMVVFKTISH